MSMRERLLQLYRLNQIDKELNELYSLRGDIPSKIEDLSSEKNEFTERNAELQGELDEIIEAEKNIQVENDELLERMEKNDSILRSGNVKSNKEYDALAREIEDAKSKITSNEKSLKDENSGKKSQLENELSLVKGKLEEVDAELAQNQKELEELSKQTEEEERELKNKREELLKNISPEDFEYYDRLKTVKFGEAVAIVRKGSCLGCYSSIPPQKAIEIRMAERFFNCESCGRILIAEEILTA